MNGAGLMLLYLALFVGVLLSFEGIMQLVLRRREGEDAVNRRLRMLASGADPEEVLKLLRRHRQPTGLERLPGVQAWQALVIQSGMSIKPDHLLSLLMLSAAAFVVVLIVLGIKNPCSRSAPVSPPGLRCRSWSSARFAAAGRRRSPASCRTRST